MPKAGIAGPLATTPPPLLSNPVTVGALVTLGALVGIQAAYQRLLKLTVFGTTFLRDKKDALKYQKTLLAQPALVVLMLIWKDSSTVSDADIAAAGVTRLGSSCEPLNCHNLATRMAVDAGDFDRQQKRIQSVVTAAEAYGLVVRRPAEKSRRKALCGTQALHKLMLALSTAVQPICAEVGAVASGGL